MSGFQFDVKSAHINGSGQMVTGRTRLKGIIGVGSGTAGTANIWDAIAAPTAVTYGRTGTTVTITLASHGLTTGDVVGLVFSAGTGGTATNGNYAVTVLTSSTYTITDINSGSITAGAAGFQSAVGSRWVTSWDTAGNSTTVTLLVPGDGIWAVNGLYGQLTNQTGLTVFYG
jgi:hypothetical protein